MFGGSAEVDVGNAGGGKAQGSAGGVGETGEHIQGEQAAACVWQSGRLTIAVVFARSCHTRYRICMTMLSFRVDETEARQVQEWADRLGVDRSELLRDAVRRQLNRLASDNDAATWQRQPLDDGERALSAIADWGPAEDWADWAHAAR